MTMTPPENPMAFPRSATEYDTWGNHGMTLRDYFAGQALANQGNLPQHWDKSFIAKWAYSVADAMLAARSVKDDA